MPSFAVTGIANRLFNKKKADDKATTTVETEEKSIHSTSSFYSDGPYPPSESVLSPHSGGGESNWGDSDEEKPPGEKVERGVKQAEAIAAVWSKKALVFAYIG